MSTMTTSNNKWVLPIAVNAAGTITKTLETAGNLVDKNIDVTVTTPNGDYSASVSSHTITKPTITPSIGGNITGITQTSTPSGTNGTDYWTIDPGGSVTTNGSSSVTATATISSAGYISAGNKTASDSITLNSSQITIAEGINRYLLKASITSTSGTASATANAGTASITTQPTASATTTITPSGISGGYYTDNTTSSYYVDVSASASSNSGVVTATGGSANASVTASSIAVGVGYNPTSQTISTAASNTGTKTGNTVTTTAVTANDSANQKIYFKLSGITTSSTNDGMSTYFNSGSSSDKNVTITPKYTATAGYRPAVSTATNNGGTTYWKIKTTSATQGTSTISNNTVTRGITSWGTGWITADSISSASFTNTATANVTYLDISNTTEAPVLVVEDNNNKNASYLYINKGYTDNLKISLGKLLADNATITGGADYSSNQMLSGYTAYDKDGKLFTGNIPTKTADDLTASGKTVTVPIGYYSTTATKSISVGTITSGTATISSATYTYDSTNACFNVTGSANVSAPTVNTAGYVSSTEGTKNTKNNGATLNTTVAKIAIKATMSGTAKVTPTISKITTASGNSATNITAAVSAATPDKPTSGYYVAVQSAASANDITATPSVSTAGYGTTSYYSASTSTLSVGANASSVTYFSITAASISSEGSVTTAPSVTIGGTTNMATANSGTYYFTRTGTANNGTVQTKWKNATAGYAAKNTSGTNSGTVTVTPTKTNDTTIYIPTAQGSITMNAGSGSCTLQSSSNITFSDSNTSGVLVTFRGSGSVSAIAKTTAGYTPTNNSFATGSSTSSNTADLTKYITGVELTKGKSFRIKVPNGPLNSDGTNNDTITFVFTVANDNTGNVTVAGPD